MRARDNVTCRDSSDAGQVARKIEEPGKSTLVSIHRW